MAGMKYSFFSSHSGGPWGSHSHLGIPQLSWGTRMFVGEARSQVLEPMSSGAGASSNPHFCPCKVLPCCSSMPQTWTGPGSMGRSQSSTPWRAPLIFGSTLARVSLHPHTNSFPFSLVPFFPSFLPYCFSPFTLPSSFPLACLWKTRCKEVTKFQSPRLVTVKLLGEAPTEGCDA